MHQIGICDEGRLVFLADFAHFPAINLSRACVAEMDVNGQKPITAGRASDVPIHFWIER